MQSAIDVPWLVKDIRFSRKLVEVNIGGRFLFKNMKTLRKWRPAQIIAIQKENNHQIA